MVPLDILLIKIYEKVNWYQPDCSLSYSSFFHVYDLGVSYTFHFHKRNTESSVIFLWNDVLTLNGKENKKASAICFERRILKKKNKELLRKVPSKIYEVILSWKKRTNKIGLLIFPNTITEQWGYDPLDLFRWEITYLNKIKFIWPCCVVAPFGIICQGRIPFGFWTFFSFSPQH